MLKAFSQLGRRRLNIRTTRNNTVSSEVRRQWPTNLPTSVFRAELGEELLNQDMCAAEVASPIKGTLQSTFSERFGWTEESMCSSSCSSSSSSPIAAVQCSSSSQLLPTYTFSANTPVATFRQQVHAALEHPAFADVDRVKAAHEQLRKAVRGAASSTTCPTVLDDNLLRKARAVYLRARMGVEYIQLVVDAIAMSSASHQPPGWHDGILEYFVAIAGRRETELPAKDQWKLCIQNLVLALPLLKSVGTAVQYATNIAVFSESGAPASNVLELVQAGAQLWPKEGDKRQRFVDSVAEHSFQAALKKMQVTRFHPRQLGSLLQVLEVCTHAGSAVNNARTKLQLSSLDSHVLADTVARLLEKGKLAEHVPNQTHRARTVRQILTWFDGCLPQGCRWFSFAQIWAHLIRNPSDLRATLLSDQAALSSSSTAANIPLTWKCGCNRVNPILSSTCLGCGQGGTTCDWTCSSCNTPNPSTCGDDEPVRCLGCFRHHPRTATLQAAGLWFCRSCDLIGQEGHPCSCSSVSATAVVTCGECRLHFDQSLGYCPGCGSTSQNGPSTGLRHCQECSSDLTPTRLGPASSSPAPDCVTCNSTASRSATMSMFRWECGCGQWNAATRLSCMRCSNAKSECIYTCPQCLSENVKALAKVPANRLGLGALPIPSATSCNHCHALHPRTDVFLSNRLAVCPHCNTTNDTLSGNCWHCNTAIDKVLPLLRQFPDRPWSCSHCSHVNSLHRGVGGGVSATTCEKCDSARPQTPSSSWTCPVSTCGEENLGGVACRSCSTLHPTVASAEVSVWVCACDHKTKTHPSWAHSCGECGQVAPAAVATSTTPHDDEKRSFRYIPWRCKCNHFNSALTIHRCEACHTTRRPHTSDACPLCGTFHLSKRCPQDARQRQLTSMESMLLQAAQQRLSDTTRSNPSVLGRLLGPADWESAARLFPPPADSTATTTTTSSNAECFSRDSTHRSRGRQRGRGRQSQ